jgi:molybdate transport system permease protein
MDFPWFSLWLSFKVAILATLISAAAGLWLAWVLATRSFRGKELIDAAVTLPLVLPPTVLGYYLLLVLARSTPIGRAYESLFGQPLVFTWQAAVVASTIHAIPLLVKSARAGFESADPIYGRAARSLGAGEWRLFWRVAFPLGRRAIIAATVVAFARSLGDFGATLMIAGDIPFRTQTAAIAIFDAVEAGHTRIAGGLTLMISLVAMLIVYGANRLEHRPSR